MRRFSVILPIIIGISGLFMSGYVGAEAASRKFKPADRMPKFTVVDDHGLDFQYSPGESSALLVLFFSPEKKQSMKAVEDIKMLLDNFDNLPHKLTFLAVSEDPNSFGELKVKNSTQLSVHFVNDSDFKLWGTFGIIASPTVFLAGADGKIELIKAGYGYDFAPAIKSEIQVIMGLTKKGDIREVEQVRTVTNKSVHEKANRHLNMAKMLESKGRYDAALSQLETAIQVDPNSTECSLEIARLYCLTSEPNKAINAVENLCLSSKAHQASRAFILGKAYGQLNDYSAAEKYFLKTVDFDPKNSQALYELGKIYQLQGHTDKALEIYRKSLDIIFELNQQSP